MKQPPSKADDEFITSSLLLLLRPQDIHHHCFGNVPRCVSITLFERHCLRNSICSLLLLLLILILFLFGLVIALIMVGSLIDSDLTRLLQLLDGCLKLIIFIIFDLSIIDDVEGSC